MLYTSEGGGDQLKLIETVSIICDLKDDGKNADRENAIVRQSHSNPRKPCYSLSSLQSRP
jgi:hypothetical protein